MQRFVLIGAAAYIAPRHMQAIQAVRGELVAALDPHDSVGILDRYSMGCRYFREIEQLDRWMDTETRASRPIHWVVVCSPNYLHDAHCRFGLQHGANVICEKPLTIAMDRLERLQSAEDETGKQINTILQLRVHDGVRQFLHESLAPNVHYDVDLTYVTSRGPWYAASWKGNQELTGGLAFNIGIHFLDLLLWLFGDYDILSVYHRDDMRVAGYFSLKNARVRWFLSVDPADLPEGNQGPVYRALTVTNPANGNTTTVDLSAGFTDLHTRVYEQTLDGHGFGTDVVAPSIELAEHISRYRGGMRADIKWSDVESSDFVHPFLDRHK